MWRVRLPVRGARVSTVRAWLMLALAFAPVVAGAAQSPAGGGSSSGGGGATPPSAVQSYALPDTIAEARTTALASQLRCPVCQGLSIQDSPSELSQQMRALVKEQVEAGKSDDEIRSYFVARYGEWILLKPRPRGANLLVYALPLALLVAGGAAVALSVRRWVSPPGQGAGHDGDDRATDEGAEHAGSGPHPV